MIIVSKLLYFNRMDFVDIRAACSLVAVQGIPSVVAQGSPSVVVLGIPSAAVQGIPSVVVLGIPVVVVVQEVEYQDQLASMSES